MKGKYEAKVEQYEQEIAGLRKVVREREEVIGMNAMVKEQLREVEERFAAVC